MNNTYWHLKAALRSVLQRKGYHFVKSQWVKQCDEVTQVVCLDKSPDGDEYYLEVGVFIHLLGSPPSMLMRYAPYRARLCGRLNNEYDELLFVYLNRDVITDAERERRFRDLLESDTAPLLDCLTSIAGLRECYWHPFNRNVAVFRTASPLLFGTDIAPRENSTEAEQIKGIKPL